MSEQTRQIFDKAAREIIAEIRANMVSEGVNASGKTSNSLEYEATDNSLTIRGAKSFTWVEQGRRPGTPPPFPPILEWVEAKLGLSGKEAVGVAWAVVKSIGERGSVTFKGYDRRSVFTDLITEARVDAIVAQVQPVSVYQVEKEIFEPLGNMFEAGIFKKSQP